MITLRDITDFLGVKDNIKTFDIDFEAEISQPSSLIENSSYPFFLFWVNDKNLEKIASLRNGIVISPKMVDPGQFKGAIICCEKPRKAFADVIRRFFTEDERPVEGFSIGHGNVIEEGVKIGNGVIIGHNNVIHRGTVIEDNVTIGSNNTIGGVGFGYEPAEDGSYDLIPHIGGVLIEKNVEIGNNTCIDRAVLGNTTIGEDTKIDNLVHIAHGVKIGKSSLIIANSMIAGSVNIGDRCWVAPSTSIINGCSMGSDSMTGMGSVVVKSIESSVLVAGVPAKKMRDLCAE